MLEAIPNNQDDELRRELVCGLAALEGLAGVPGSGVSADPGRAEVDRAMALMRQPGEDRTASLKWYRPDPALDAIRERADFPWLTMVMAFPARPFAAK